MMDYTHCSITIPMRITGYPSNKRPKLASTWCNSKRRTRKNTWGANSNSIVLIRVSTTDHKIRNYLKTLINPQLKTAALDCQIIDRKQHDIGVDSTQRLHYIRNKNVVRDQQRLNPLMAKTENCCNQ